MRGRPIADFAGLAIVAMALAGCGEDPQIEEGTTPFKGTNTSALEPLRDEMTRNMRNQSYLKRDDEGGKKPAGPGESAGAKPAGGAKPGSPPGPSTEGG